MKAAFPSSFWMRLLLLGVGVLLSIRMWSLNEQYPQQNFVMDALNQDLLERNLATKTLILEFERSPKNDR